MSSLPRSVALKHILTLTNGNWGGNGIVFWYFTSSTGECKGDITATFTWQAATPDDVPPLSAIVVENSSASYNFSGSVLAATCADGFGDAPVVNGSSALSSGVRYSVKQNPGQSFNITCTPNAKVTGAGGGSYSYAGVSVAYNATATPVAIGVLGTTRDVPNNADAVLIGQGLNVSLSAGYPQSGWQWTISGDPFAGFVTTATSGKAKELLDADMQKAGVSYFYRSLGGANGGSAPSTITCAATITLPDHTQPSVTATKKLTVYPPTSVSFVSKYGDMDIYIFPGNVLYLMPYDSTITRGMQWVGKATTPALFTANGSGSWGVAQLVTPVLIIDGVSTFPLNTTGHDGTFPYDQFDANGNPSTDGDSPRKGLASVQASLEFDCTFQTFMLYTPPAGPSGTVTWVPLYELDWNFSGKANLVGGIWKPMSCLGITVTHMGVTSTLPAWQNVVSVPK